MARDLRVDLDVAPLLSLAAGYAGPPFTARAPLGPAGRRRSLEERRFVIARDLRVDLDVAPLASS